MLIFCYSHCRNVVPWIPLWMLNVIWGLWAFLLWILGGSTFLPLIEWGSVYDKEHVRYKECIGVTTWKLQLTKGHLVNSIGFEKCLINELTTYKEDMEGVADYLKDIVYHMFLLVEAGPLDDENMKDMNTMDKEKPIFFVIEIGYKQIEISRFESRKEVEKYFAQKRKEKGLALLQSDKYDSKSEEKFDRRKIQELFKEIDDNLVARRYHVIHWNCKALTDHLFDLFKLRKEAENINTNLMDKLCCIPFFMCFFIFIFIAMAGFLYYTDLFVLYIYLNIILSMLMFFIISSFYFLYRGQICQNGIGYFVMGCPAIHAFMFIPCFYYYQLLANIFGPSFITFILWSNLMCFLCSMTT